MTTNKRKKNRDLFVLTKILMLTTLCSILSLQKSFAETVPSFPAPTMVDQKKSPSKFSPLESGMTDERLNDPQALNAIRTLIQGGIPVGQSKTQIMNNVTPISQYSGSSTSTPNPDLNSSYRYVVKKGDTLNQIIKTTFNQHPLKMKVIGEIIIANNKKAFPSGKPTSMQAGATLIIPSVDAIAGMDGSGKRAPLVKKSNPYVSTNPHRGWVRFP